MENESALRALSFIIGRWQTSGEVKAGDGQPAMRIQGTDTYEWTLDGAFILHHVDVLMGAEKTQTLELIGYDPATGTYSLRSFDQQGNFTTMEGTIDRPGHFIVSGEGMRSTLTAHPDGQHMSAHWERSIDGVWEYWMEMGFEK